MKKRYTIFFSFEFIDALTPTVPACFLRFINEFGLSVWCVCVCSFLYLYRKSGTIFVQNFRYCMKRNKRFWPYTYKFGSRWRCTNFNKSCKHCDFIFDHVCYAIKLAKHYNHVMMYIKWLCIVWVFQFFIYLFFFRSFLSLGREFFHWNFYATVNDTFLNCIQQFTVTLWIINSNL